MTSDTNDVRGALCGSFEALQARIVDCRQCPRLVEWRERVARERRKAFSHWDYWGKAVPNFGDPEATRLIVGLAPAAHGANRTGRMFTGDESGAWLYRALHRAGVASQADSTSIGDGLTLKGALITAIIHCCPPGNKPTRAEIDACSPFLVELLESRRWKSVLCLGSLAWAHAHRAFGIRVPAFGHLAMNRIKRGVTMVASYHPSQQNTFTGKLTQPMLDAAIDAWLRA